MAKRASLKVAWAAGVIEGEGYIGITDGRLRQDGTRVKAFRIRVVMADKDIILQLHKIFHLGKVHAYSNKYGCGKKPLFLWEVIRASDVRTVARTIRPFMGRRRRQRLDDLLSELRQYKFVNSRERARRVWITRGRKYVARNAQIARLRCNGWTHAQIAQRTGLRRASVSGILGRLGFRGRNDPRMK